MEDKQLAEDTEETDSIYSIDSATMRELLETYPLPSYNPIPASNPQRDSRWKRFLAIEVQLKHILLFMVIYWTFFYLNEAINIPYWLGEAWSSFSYTLYNLFKSEPPMPVISGRNAEGYIDVPEGVIPCAFDTWDEMTSYFNAARSKSSVLSSPSMFIIAVIFIMMFG